MRVEHPILPNVRSNARDPNNSFHPLVIAAIYVSKKAAEFLLNNGVDRATITVAMEKAKQYGHPEIIRLLTDYSSHRQKKRRNNHEFVGLLSGFALLRARSNMAEQIKVTRCLVRTPGMLMPGPIGEQLFLRGAGFVE